MSEYRLDPKTQQEIKATLPERILAPSLRAWSKLAERETLGTEDWNEFFKSFQANMNSTESRMRLTIGILALVVVVLVGLAAIIGASLKILGHVLFNLTGEPRWAAVVLVAAVALAAGWYLRRTVELRRRVEWQAQLLRQITDSVKMLSYKDDQRRE